MASAKYEEIRKIAFARRAARQAAPQEAEAAAQAPISEAQDGEEWVTVENPTAEGILELAKKFGY